MLLTPDDDVSLAIEASFGLLLSPEDDRWFWVCHEAILPPLAPVFPRYARNPAGVLLAAAGMEVDRDGRSVSLLRSPDGCSWQLPDGLDGALVVDASFDPSDGSRALAATASVGEGVFNTIAVSEDAGLTWSRDRLDESGRFYRSLAWSADVAGLVWAAANHYQPGGSWLLRSSDGGETWTERAIELRSAEGAPLLNPDVRAALGEDIVLITASLPDDEQVLLRSDDGGQSFLPVLQSPEVLWDVATDDGELVLVTTDDGQLFRSVDGTTFELLDGAPPTRSVAQDERGLFLGGTNDDEAGLRLSLDGGDTSEPLMSYVDLEGVLPCAPETQTAIACEPLWERAALLLELWATPDDDDAADDDDDDESAADDDPSESADPSPPSCEGCGGTLAPGSGALLVLAVFASRRRLHGGSAGAGGAGA